MLVKYQASLFLPAVQALLAGSSNISSASHNAIMVQLSALSDALANPERFGAMDFPSVNTRLGPGSAVGLSDEPYSWWQADGLRPEEMEARVLFRAAQQIIRILRNFRPATASDGTAPAGSVSFRDMTLTVPTEVFGAAEWGIVPEDLSESVPRVQYDPSVNVGMLGGAAYWIWLRGMRLAMAMKTGGTIPAINTTPDSQRWMADCVYLADSFTKTRRTSYLIVVIGSFALLLLTTAAAALSKPKSGAPQATLFNRKTPVLPPAPQRAAA